MCLTGEDLVPSTVPLRTTHPNVDDFCLTVWHVNRSAPEIRYMTRTDTVYVDRQQTSNQAAQSWAESLFKNIVYWNRLDAGGHFAAMERPALFAGEIRAAFRHMRL